MTSDQRKALYDLGTVPGKDHPRCGHSDCHVPASRLDTAGSWTCGNHDTDKPKR